MRACQRDGLFRIERDRQGVMRIFPGNVMQTVSEPVTVEPDGTEEDDGQRTFLDMGPDRNADEEDETSDEPWQPEPGNVAEPRPRWWTATSCRSSTRRSR